MQGGLSIFWIARDVDLVLSDIHMPRVDGIAIDAHLRSISQRRLLFYNCLSSRCCWLLQGADSDTYDETGFAPGFTLKIPHRLEH